MKPSSPALDGLVVRLEGCWKDTTNGMQFDRQKARALIEDFLAAYQSGKANAA